MNDTTKLSDVHIGIDAKISLLSDSTRFSEGMVYEIISKTDDPLGIIVVLKNGSTGHCKEIKNSIEIIKDRISAETQYSENKEVFGESVMKEEVIPKTIQSFLNATGGYLYIGVNDEGKPVGLNFDHELIENAKGETLSDAKFEDYFELEILDTLRKHLRSNNNVGHLLGFKFPEIDGVKILEIHILPSSHPFFFKYFTRRGPERIFKIVLKDGESPKDRFFDDFYIREGNGKQKVDTKEAFYNYSKNRFKNLI